MLRLANRCAQLSMLQTCNLNEIWFTAFGSLHCPDAHVDMAASNYDRTAVMRCTLLRDILSCPI